MPDPITWNLRIVASDNAPATAYVRQHRYTIGEPVHFDAQYPQVTALELALSALAADLVGTLRVLARRRRIILDNVEAVVSGELNNPLSYLEVVGEEGTPSLGRVSIVVYISSLTPEAEVQQLWRNAQELAPLTQTFKNTIILYLALNLTV